MRISDWSSDVCSSDLADRATAVGAYPGTVDIGLLPEQGRVLQAADEIHGFLREVRLEMLPRVCAYYRCRRHHGQGPPARHSVSPRNRAGPGGVDREPRTGLSEFAHQISADFGRAACRESMCQFV